MFPTEKFHSVLQNIHHVESKKSSEENTYHRFEGVSSSDYDLFGSGLGPLQVQDNAAELELQLHENQIHQLQHFAEFGKDDLYLDVVSPPFQSCDDDILKIVSDEPPNTGVIESNEKTLYAFPSTSLQILREHGTRRLRFAANNSSHTQSSNSITPRPSTEAIIELAAKKFIQSTSQSSNEISTLSHPYPDSILGLSEEDLKGIQLIQFLLSSAEKLGEKQYERARKLLHECYILSSPAGNPIQRLAFYFVEALYKRIDKETGRITLNDLGKKPIDPLEKLNWPNEILIAFHKEHPLSQIAKFAGIQAIVDHVAKASKVHLIDLEIRSGIHCIILMQALAARCEHPIQHLKVTAIGTKSRPIIEEAGRQLISFAQSLNLKFYLDIVMVEDILDLKESHFKLDADEAVAVYAAYTLTRFIGRADRLETMMKEIKNINPCVMIVTEIEANCNSPTFVERFVEALFFFGAFFDSLADCMKNEENIRREAESTCFSSCIRNVLAAEGEEREIRHVSINVWRAFFICCGFVEIELSVSSLCHANLVLQRFSCGNSCTLDMNGKCLTIGWKGTPLSSLSVWKVQQI